MKAIRTYEQLTVYANIDLTAEMQQREAGPGVQEYCFHLQWNEEQARDAKARLLLEWVLPCVDVQYMWHPNTRSKRVLDGNWRLHHTSMLTVSAPVGTVFNGRDENVYTFATDEVKRVTQVHLGVEDSSNTITARVSMNLKQFVGRCSHTMNVRADYRRISMAKVLDDVRAWWDDVLPGKPLTPPETAWLPMYSSWYGYHQRISAQELEKECRLAYDMGMRAIIVDDGWQTEDASSGYGFTGDWQVYPGKIPDMRAHVRNVHAAGLKYILWYSVPYVGYHSRAWARFEDKLLYRVDRSACGVLDPRYSEVRAYLLDIYESAVREWDLDGLKLDFIDRFVMPDDDELKPGMDFDCVQEAAGRLLADVVTRLTDLKPDILLEFRQSYIGPMMRRFGNMFRVGDCASDITSNRIGTIDLRLLGGSTACHSDMLTWSAEETPEDAALQILNAIFGVIQFSMIISDMTEEHLRMSRFWLDFAIQNRRVLLQSGLQPQELHFLYPVVQAMDTQEAIIAVYARDKVVDLPAGMRRIQLINATKDAQLILRTCAPQEMQAIIQSVFGEVVESRTLTLPEGIHAVNVPRSGLLTLTKA